MKKDLLLIIDMQNVYGPGGAWECPGSGEAAANIKKLISRCGEELDVIFTEFLPPEKPEGAWKEYNRVNSEINEDAYANAMMDVFSEELKRFPLYPKSVYSSLKVPEVREAVSRADRVLLSGVVAECCVLFTAADLIDFGAKVILLTDAAAGIDENTEEAVKTVLSGLVPAQAELMTTEEYLRSKMGV